MADSKQANPNGAYYWPPVPTRHSYRRMGRGSSCCRGPCCCTLFKILLSIVITLGVIVLILWLVFRPNPVKVYVEEASLAQFDLSANGTLAYTLNMTVSFRNPNMRVSIHYDYIEAWAIYDGSRFGFETLLPFFQGRQNTSMLYPLFEGERLALGSVATTFNREKGEGTFNIDVKVHTSVRFKVWFIKSSKYTHDADCSLRFPVPTASGSPSVIQRTKCNVHLF